MIEKHSGIKERRRAAILDSAMDCFCRGGIETTALVDIAAQAQVGEATLYRYFSTKENLVMDCGIRFWEKAGERYTELTENEDYAKMSGMEQVEALLKLTEAMFAQEQRDFKFLHDLDVYMTSHRVNTEKLREYEQLVGRSGPLLCEAIEKGKADGTVTQTTPTIELYYTLTHTMLSLMQKMAAMGDLLSGDRVMTKERRVTLLRELLLAGLR